jgi:holo-[acyl-carrier protein] synthase
MIGCDVVKINRFSKKLERWALKVLTPLELEEYSKKTNKLEYLSGRWAAKEAIFKAAGAVNISILTDNSGKPYVLGNDKLAVSISHEREYVFAVAFLNK